MHHTTANEGVSQDQCGVQVDVLQWPGDSDNYVTWHSGVKTVPICHPYSMVKIRCPFPDCAFEADHDKAVVTAALLNIHATYYYFDRPSEHESR